MRRTIVCVVSCAAIVVLCLNPAENAANAQRDEKPSPGGLLGTALIPKVQNEIGIQNDTELLSRLDALRDVIVKEQQELIAITKGDKDQYKEESFRNIDLKYRDEFKKMLSAEQYKRVQQITWQVYQYRILTDPEVVEVLELTSEQVTNISAAQRENVTRQREYTASTRSRIPQASRDEVRRGLREINMAYHKKVEEIISKQQQEKFVEILGEPLK